MTTFAASNGYQVTPEKGGLVVTTGVTPRHFIGEKTAAAIHEYLTEFPKRNLWTSANVGEVWVLHVDGLGELAYVVGDFSFMHADHALPIESARITAGRRIWPVESR